VSDYRLDDRGSIPGRDKGFSSSLRVQTSSEAAPSYPGGSFPGGKARPRREADHSPGSTAKAKNEKFNLLLPGVKTKGE
jgi:hypothetical protein